MRGILSSRLTLYDRHLIPQSPFGDRQAWSVPRKALNRLLEPETICKGSKAPTSDEVNSCERVHSQGMYTPLQVHSVEVLGYGKGRESLTA